MTRLSKSEISKHKEWLKAWRTPSRMKDYVEQVNDYMGATDFFNQAGIEFLRDAWIAAEFSGMSNADLVRLSSDEWPDFETRRDGQIEQFECTEADQLGRRRGDEYREANAHADPNGVWIKDDPVEDWIKRAEQVPEILRAAVENKIGKQYAGSVQLVIYLNIGEFGIRQREIESCFSYVCTIEHGTFNAIWILWKSKIYGPFLPQHCRP